MLMEINEILQPLNQLAHVFSWQRFSRWGSHHSCEGVLDLSIGATEIKVLTHVFHNSVHFVYTDTCQPIAIVFSCIWCN